MKVTTRRLKPQLRLDHLSLIKPHPQSCHVSVGGLVTTKTELQSRESCSIRDVPNLFSEYQENLSYAKIILRSYVQKG